MAPMPAVCTLLLAVATFTACTETNVGEQRYAVAQPGPWVIPLETLAVGDVQFVEFTGAGPWIGPEGCGGSLLAGATVLREYIYEFFPQAWHIGGYSCRSINGDSSQMSVHATGRALDIMIETISKEADNDLGDPIGNWLIENAEHIGIQFIIWDRWTWMAERNPGEKDRQYNGAHPHNDHLHIELSLEAADLLTPFFENPFDPPDVPPCGVIPAQGGIVDDIDRCAQFYGPADYWRREDGVGYEGRLLWTNAFENESPSNWGRWMLDLESAGSYEVSFYVTPEFARHRRTRYEVQHGGETTVFEVDLSLAEQGWVVLGTFEFAAGGQQHVSVYDNTDEAIAEDQRIVFDAVRLLPAGGTDTGGLRGGCNSTGEQPPLSAALLIMVLWAVRRRRDDHSRV